MGILIFASLIFFIPLLLLRPVTIYTCSSGFLKKCKKNYQVARWEEITWVFSNNERCIVYLKDKKPIIISRLVRQPMLLGQEIELKARLAQHQDGTEDLESQFEQMLNRQTEQQKKATVGTKNLLFLREEPEEAFKLRDEYQMGEALGTYHAGFKGILRNKIIANTLYYCFLLLLIVPIILLLIIGVFFILNFSSIPPITDFFYNHRFIVELLSTVLALFLLPRFFEVYTRLHLYTDGFIYITGNSLEVVRWKQIEKIIYHKPTPISTLPFCHIYLKNDEGIEISRYIHQKDAIKRVFDEHIASRVQVG